MSKMKYYNEAERLYLYDNLSIDEIYKQLNLSRRTVYYWKNKFNWDKKLAERFKNKEAMSQELLEFIRKLMKRITTDIENKTPVNQSLFYSLNNLLKFMPDIQKYETEVQKTKEPDKRFPTEEEIKEIEREIFGIQ